MEKELALNETIKHDYYGTIRKNLKKQYSALEKSEINTLTREVIFAPYDYTTEIDETPIPISRIRESLADSIYNREPVTSSISYSLEADLADMIEKNNCETSSMNEYYRWLKDTSDIIQHTTDNDITDEDLSERNEFLSTCNERETEILLCLSLYEGARNNKKDKKVEILKFKLLRLREMRSIIRNTPSSKTSLNDMEKARLIAQYDYCVKLLSEKPNLSSDFNDILKLNINHISNEDLEVGYSYLCAMQSEILQMLRETEKTTAENQHSENSEEKDSVNTLNPNLSSVRETEGR